MERSGTPAPCLLHPHRCLCDLQRRTAGGESPTTTGRRDAPGTITTNHTRKPPHRAPHPPHHHSGAPPTAPHHPGPQRVLRPATGMGGPQRHTPMGRNQTGAPGHSPPLDHRAHHHLGTTDRPPPPPPHRPKGCHNHTNGGEAPNSSPRPRRPHTPASIVGTYGSTSRPRPMASHRHHLPHPQTTTHTPGSNGGRTSGGTSSKNT